MSLALTTILCILPMQAISLDQFFHEQALAAKLLRDKQLKAIEDCLWSPAVNMQHGEWIQQMWHTLFWLSLIHCLVFSGG
jgi:hypothetical protein